MLKKIKKHFETKAYSKIIRAWGKTELTDFTAGYIVGYSDDFIILQETDDFRLLGYLIIPIKQIKKVRHNKWDKYYNKIMESEGKTNEVSLRYPVDLKNWKSIFDSIQGHNLKVIANCELSDEHSFTIGPIIRAKKKSVEIQGFDPAGFVDEETTTIQYKEITKVAFDDRYANVFGKYLRKRHQKLTITEN
jgi:hypothetical protein